MLHDFRGLVLASKAVLHEHVRFAFSAEALTCTDAVSMCENLGIKKL